jgi:hypothetical protein
MRGKKKSGEKKIRGPKKKKKKSAEIRKHLCDSCISFFHVVFLFRHTFSHSSLHLITRQNKSFSPSSLDKNLQFISIVKRKTLPFTWRTTFRFQTSGRARFSFWAGCYISILH